MEKWFSRLDILTQAILLLIPFVGFIMEIGIRVFAIIRLHSKKNIIGLLIAIFFGWTILFNLIDVIVLSKTDDLMLIE